MSVYQVRTTLLVSDEIPAPLIGLSLQWIGTWDKPDLLGASSKSILRREIPTLSVQSGCLSFGTDSILSPLLAVCLVGVLSS